MAKKRLFVPALQRALGVETKSLTISGYGGLIQNRATTFGVRDSAAGWNMDTVIADGYERVVWVYKAVEVIAGNQSRLPFKITADDGNEEVEGHPLERVLNKKANPHETGRMFRKRLSQQILLSKRGAFVEVTKTRGGSISRLDLLPPDRVRIVPDVEGDYVDYYEFTRFDGEVRNLPPERVRWIREPHPLDPFSGMTPLESAGMSVELDHLARAYNVSFINRDGRPSGILGIDADGLGDEELDRIQARVKLQSGAYNAGEIMALGTGPGGLSYTDTSSRPRDMAYEALSTTSKLEILAAFGVPLSLAGDASGRTFDNAEQEEYNFWHDPMLPHLDLIAQAFDEDIDEDLDCGFDTSKVDALELPARRRRTEAREEFNDGLRSISEYRVLADDLDEIDNAQTRALWVSPAKAPVPGRAGDEEALGLGDTSGGGLGGPPATDPNAPVDPNAPGAAQGQTAAEVVQEAVALGGTPSPSAAVAGAPVDGAAAAAVNAARLDASGGAFGPGDAAAAVDAARMEGKSLEEAPAGSYKPTDEQLHRTELAVAAALQAMLARQAGVVAARLESPKIRKGTPYWTATDPEDTRTGAESINSEKVIDVARWAAETQETLAPLVAPAAKDSASGLLASMVAAGVLAVPAATGAPVAGRAAATTTATAEQAAEYALRAAAAPTMLAVTVAVEAMSEWLRDRMVDVDHAAVEAAGDLAVLTEKVRKMWEHKAQDLAESLAVTVAQTAVAGGREAAVGDLMPQVPAPTGGELVDVPAVIDRYWVTRHDEKVRASHDAADGQMRPVGVPFTVGGYDMRYPSDPLAPPSVSRFCRCWLTYEWPADASFVLPA